MAYLYVDPSVCSQIGDKPTRFYVEYNTNKPDEDFETASKDFATIDQVDRFVKALTGCFVVYERINVEGRRLGFGMIEWSWQNAQVKDG